MLMAIGGGMNLRGAVLAEFFRLSGGSQARIAILPTASALPNAGKDVGEALQELGMSKPATWLDIHTREQAENEAFLQDIRDASGIFIAGGNQMRLTTIWGGTRFERAIKDRYAAGCVVAGTSAGAAALSALMISSGKSGQAVRVGAAQFSAGLGFEGRVIFDQHFNQRNRVGRLVYAVASNPALIGVGIDEDTAAIIAGDELRVVGRGSVTLVDGKRIKDSDLSEAKDRQLVAICNVTMHYLTNGCWFDLSTRIPYIVQQELSEEKGGDFTPNANK